MLCSCALCSLVLWLAIALCGLFAFPLLRSYALLLFVFSSPLVSFFNFGDLFRLSLSSLSLVVFRSSFVVLASASVGSLVPSATGSPSGPSQVGFLLCALLFLFRYFFSSLLVAPLSCSSQFRRCIHLPSWSPPLGWFLRFVSWALSPLVPLPWWSTFGLGSLFFLSFPFFVVAPSPAFAFGAASPFLVVFSSATTFFECFHLCSQFCSSFPACSLRDLLALLR